MKPTYINPAEAILDPLFDSSLSGFKRKLWTVQPRESHGLKIFSNWAWLQFEWARRPATGPALQLSRKFDVEVSHFDQLLVSLMAPLDSIVRLRVETDAGPREESFAPAPVLKRECAVSLEGATRILGLEIAIDAAQDEPANGWINWVGLQDSGLLPSYLRSLRSYDSKWELHLQPEDYEPTFNLSYGIVVSEEELAVIREKHAAHLQEFGESSYTKAAEIARQVEPELRINDFVNFWGDTRFSRERDHGRDLLNWGSSDYGISLALAGQFTKDKALLRRAARFALSLAHCPHWDDGMISRVPGSSWEHRCFVISLCCHTIGVVLDLAGDHFTHEGRSFLLRRLAESGLGSMNFQTWRHDYIFKCNQLAWFSPGRILVSTILERHFPRVKPYTEIAYQELLESLETTILPDGGYVEGVVYFSCAVGKDGGRALAYYARARGKSLAEVIPDCLRRSADFGAALSSTDEDADIIAICDNGSGRADQPLLAAMASALPQSHWVNLYRKSLARTQGLPEDLFALQLANQIPESAPPPPALIAMPVMGVVASHRPYQGGIVKLFLMGNLANAGHTHEDKGSFVLEVAGETLAQDFGMCEYASSMGKEYQSAQRHTMLVPTGTVERACPQNPLPFDIRPQAEGDDTFFRAEVDLTPGWEGYYEFWKRRWDSPTPDTLVITDDYALARGDGVDDEAALERAHIDPVALAARITKLIYRQIFDFGFFHGDPHPGNVAIQKDGTVGLYDYGMMGNFTPDFRLSVANLVSGLAEKNHRQVMRSILEMSEEGYVDDSGKMLSDVEEFSNQHLNHPLKDIKLGEVLNNLLALLRNHRLRMKRAFYLGVKALTQVEAIGRSLDPDLNFIVMGEPYATEVITGQYKPKRMIKLFQRLFGETVDFLEEFPHDFRAFYLRFKRGDINLPLQHKIDPEGFEPLRKTLDSIANRLANAILVASVLICSSIIVLSHIPPHVHGVSLIGIIGLGFGTYMCLRLILSIWRHGGL